MEELKSQLSEILKKDKWTQEEKKWLLKYLETSDTSELQDLMQGQFDEDNSQKQLHPDLSQGMLQGIHKSAGIEIEKQKAYVIKRWIRTISIAASVILVVGLAWMFFNKNKQASSIVYNQAKKTDSLVFVVQHEVNNSGMEKSIKLPDGSLIVLANKSEITYRVPFVYERDVTLIGKAFFKVAKDTTKPFTVFSGDISTTAIGTEFTVTTFKKDNEIIVRLYEGKVVVRAIDKSNKQLKSDVYLMPGQAFIYGGQSRARVKKFPLNASPAPVQIIKRELPLDNPSLPQDTEGSWYQFNNQSLEEVFDQMAKMFDVQIIYKKQDIQNIYLTAKFNAIDSLESILKEIANLHDLTLIKQENSFIISK